MTTTEDVNNEIEFIKRQLTIINETIATYKKYLIKSLEKENIYCDQISEMCRKLTFWYSRKQAFEEILISLGE